MQGDLPQQRRDAPPAFAGQPLPNRRRQIAHGEIQAIAPMRSALETRFSVIRRNPSNYERRCQWYIEEVFVKVNGKLCFLWRAVDHEGEVLETVATAKRDNAAALKFLKHIMKKYVRAKTVVTDGLSCYPAAMKEIGVTGRHEVGGRLNNRAENSHQPFRRRERAMQRFRSMTTLQKFSSIHAQAHNHFNQERHLVSRAVYKNRRSAALAEWRALGA